MNLGDWSNPELDKLTQASEQESAQPETPSAETSEKSDTQGETKKKKLKERIYDKCKQLLGLASDAIDDDFATSSLTFVTTLLSIFLLAPYDALCDIGLYIMIHKNDWETNLRKNIIIGCSAGIALILIADLIHWHLDIFSLLFFAVAFTLLMVFSKRIPSLPNATEYVEQLQIQTRRLQTLKASKRTRNKMSVSTKTRNTETKTPRKQEVDMHIDPNDSDFNFDLKE